MKISCTSMLLSLGLVSSVLAAGSIRGGADQKPQEGEHMTRKLQKLQGFGAQPPDSAFPLQVRQRRELVKLQGFGGQPPASAFPLQLCQGDCDGDEDCAPGLRCFYRDASDPVPDCQGGEDFDADTDFCVYGHGMGMDATEGTMAAATEGTMAAGTEPTVVGGSVTMTDAPPTEGVPPPTEAMNSEGLPYLDTVGDESAAIGLPLGLCQGNCDTDEDCLDDLVCMQRDAFEEVPGCFGAGVEAIDYCFRTDGSMPGGMAATDPGPTEVVEVPQADGTFIMTVTGNPNLPLGLCQGDCDNDDECLDDLICFQRDYLEPVPGCQGRGRISYDYCIVDPNLVPGTAAPPATLPEPTTNIAEALAADPQYTILYSLLVAAGLVDTMSDASQEFTVFAPTNEAFGLVPVSVLAEVQADPAGALTTVLLYHVVNGTVLSTSLVDSASVPTLLTGFDVITYTDPAMVNNAYITGPDTLTTNGVIHTIDQVLLPGESTDPWLESLVGDSDLPLGLCQGDCDSDAECLDDLICFQRDYLEAIPGCKGTGRVSYDYCIKDPNAVPMNPSEPVATEAVGVATGATVAVPVATEAAPAATEAAPASTEAVGVATGATVAVPAATEAIVAGTETAATEAIVAGTEAAATEAIVAGTEAAATEAIVAGTEAAATEAAPSLLPEPGQNIVQILASNPNYSTIVELVTLTGYGETLQGDGIFTLFAPTNEAFAKLPPGTVAALRENPQDMEAVVRYHVVRDYILSTDIIEASQQTTALQGVAFSTELDSNAVFVTFDPVMVNDANVVVMDVLATNGVIHVIDNVLLPATVSLPSGDADVGVVVAALEETGVLEIVSSKSKSKSDSLDSPIGAAAASSGVDDGLLGFCQGKCKADSDCRGALVCPDRNSGDPVPGCSGLPKGGYGYCVNP